MNTAYDYDSLARIDYSQHRVDILEVFSGTSIVAWYGRIERQLINQLADAEKGRNFAYADKIREFLKIWRANEITGSINRETIETLKAAANMLAVDSWNLSAYYSGLRDALRQLIASEEELPRGIDMDQNDPMAGGGAGAPPMAPSFGPDKDKMPGGPSEPGAMPKPEDLGSSPENSPGGNEDKDKLKPEDVQHF